MPDVTVYKDGVMQRTVNVATTQGTWPFTTPAPVMPTGLQFATSYQNANGREYRGLRNLTPSIRNERIIFRDCHFNGWFQCAGGAKDVWFVNCDIGPSPDDSHPQISDGFQTNVAKNIVLDGCKIHGMHMHSSGTHTEGLQVGGVDTLWVRNCHFYDNHVFDMLLRCWSPAPIRNVVIENCILERTGAIDGVSYYSLLVAGEDPNNPTDIVIRNNRIGMPISVHPGAVRVTLQNNTPI